MLTRLKVSGFKSLVDVDVRFGPFTCIAGPNGVGKSNLFDAIKFLSNLANLTLYEAALSVRDDDERRKSDIQGLFHRIGDKYVDEMSFQVEMIVPRSAYDDYGQKANATITFLKYHLVLGYKKSNSKLSSGVLELKTEELIHINQNDASKHLLFPHNVSQWRKSVIRGKRSGAFISTVGVGSEKVIKLHQDQTKGRPFGRLAATLPRTVLSATNTAESPTAVVAKREMQSWRLLQLEPTALRRPDDINSLTASTTIGSDGSHLAATLYRLSNTDELTRSNSRYKEIKGKIYDEVANRLSELIDDINEIWVDRDEKRDLLTLFVSDFDKTPFPAQSLSDGTLRFLALSVLEQDPELQGLICLEEPENGIHPERIPAMLRLLQDIAVDVNEPTGFENPLRQVIINTHSPAVVGQVPDASLIVAELCESMDKERRFRSTFFSSLPDNWRQQASKSSRVVSLGKLLAYLNPTALEQESGAFYETDKMSKSKKSRKKIRRVVDHPYMKSLFSEVK